MIKMYTFGGKISKFFLISTKVVSICLSERPALKTIDITSSWVRGVFLKVTNSDLLMDGFQMFIQILEAKSTKRTESFLTYYAI